MPSPSKPFSLAIPSLAGWERLRLERGLPERIVIDNGTEFTSQTIERSFA